MEYEKVIAWDTPEYYYVPKTSDWYWVLGIVTIAIAIICLVFSNILLAIFILLSGLTLGLYAGRAPKMLHHELQPRGIVVGERMYPYNTLDSFWIENHEPRPEIILKSKKLLMPHIVIPCEGVSFGELHRYLIVHLPEVEHHEPIVYKLFEYFGF